MWEIDGDPEEETPVGMICVEEAGNEADENTVSPEKAEIDEEPVLYAVEELPYADNTTDDALDA